MTAAFGAISLRAFSYLWRFGTHRLAELCLTTDRIKGRVLSRPFGTGRLFLEVERSTMHRLVYLEGERFVAERFLLRSLLSAGGTAVDVGANIGYMSLLLARWLGDSGRVYAFEPDPDNYRELARNQAGNPWAQIEIRHQAVGAEAGEASLVRGINSRIDEEAEGEAVARVPIVRLDDAIQGEIRLLKIDVEGYEERVLEGASRHLACPRTSLFVEVHPGMMGVQAAQRVVDLLRSLSPDVRFYRLASSRLRALTGRYLPRLAVERVASGIDPIDQSVQEASTFWVLVPRSGSRLLDG